MPPSRGGVGALHRPTDPDTATSRHAPRTSSTRAARYDGQGGKVRLVITRAAFAADRGRCQIAVVILQGGSA